jgi:tight adherence protein C
MLLVVAAALMFGAGLWLLVSTLWPARTPLAVALQRLHTPGLPRPVDVPSTASEQSPLVRSGRWLLRRTKGAGFNDERTMQDLAVIHRPLEVQAGATVMAAVAGAVLGPLAWVLVGVTGTALPAIIPLWFALLGLLVGGIAPRVVLRAEAAKARKDFRHALGAYLDVLVLLLAANEGPEGAMETAARAGNGPAFMELRRATVQARLSGDPIWDALDELGRRINVPEVCEVAAAGGLAGERGAAIRKSLVAKARSLRTTSLASSEADARRRSQAMFAPIVLMGFGFVLFLMYPLVSSIQIGP